MALLTTSKCALCQAPLGVRDKAVNGLRSSSHSRCKACKVRASKHLRRFAHEFRLACEDGIITSEEWQSLWVKLQPSGVSRDEALAYIRQDALLFLNMLIEKTFADDVAGADEVATTDAEVHFRQMTAILEVCPKDMAVLRSKWEQAKQAQSISSSTI